MLAVSIVFIIEHFRCWKIRFIEGNSKCRHLKNWPLKGLCAGVYLSEAQNPKPPPPHLHTVYVYTVYLFTQREGRGNRGVYITVTKLGWKYQHYWMYAGNWLSPVYKLWWTFAAKALYRTIFLDDDILHWLLWVLSFYGFRSLLHNLNSKKNGDRRSLLIMWRWYFLFLESSAFPLFVRFKQDFAANSFK